MATEAAREGDENDAGKQWSPTSLCGAGDPTRAMRRPPIRAGDEGDVGAERARRPSRRERQGLPSHQRALAALEATKRTREAARPSWPLATTAHRKDWCMRRSARARTVSVHPAGGGSGSRPKYPRLPERQRRPGRRGRAVRGGDPRGGRAARRAEPARLRRARGARPQPGAQLQLQPRRWAALRGRLQLHRPRDPQGDGQRRSRRGRGGRPQDRKSEAEHHGGPTAAMVRRAMPACGQPHVRRRDGRADPDEPRRTHRPRCSMRQLRPDVMFCLPA